MYGVSATLTFIGSKCCIEDKLIMSSFQIDPVTTNNFFRPRHIPARGRSDQANRDRNDNGHAYK
jgi:hypothetical protein